MKPHAIKLAQLVLGCGALSGSGIVGCGGETGADGSGAMGLVPGSSSPQNTMPTAGQTGAGASDPGTPTMTAEAPGSIQPMTDPVAGPTMTMMPVEPNPGPMGEGGATQGMGGASPMGSAGAASGGSLEAGGNGGEASATGGAATNGGASGEPGSGGETGEGGAAPAEGSPGCGMDTNQELDDWVESSVTAADLQRRIWTRLPNTYDPMRIYPLVVLLHGCGNETNNVPMQNSAGEDAILVRSVAQTDCWDTGQNSPNIALFEEMVTVTGENFCIDQSRVFAVGYSSGSWLINRLSCSRPDLFRAAGTVAGGDPGFNCLSDGNIAHIFIHDQNDPENNISGSENARDRLLESNGCDTASDPVPEDPDPCARYQGCDPAYPVVWCPTQGEGHGRQDNFAATTFWNFFVGLN